MKQQTITVEEYQALARANWTEEEFLQAVIALAKECGWRSHHQRPARTNRGWRTTVQGSGRGFPDCVLCHPILQKVIFAELKTDAGRLSLEQEQWLEVLRQAGCAAYCWRPAQWDEIERILRGEEISTTRVAYGEEK